MLKKIKQAIQKIGFQHIILDETNQTVYLEKAGSKIGFGAIGKGYAADATKKLLIQSGAKAGIINASGDLTTWGDTTRWNSLDCWRYKSTQQKQSFFVVSVKQQCCCNIGKLRKIY